MMPRTSSAATAAARGPGCPEERRAARAWWRGSRGCGKSTGVPPSALDAHLETVAAAFARFGTRAATRCRRFTSSSASWSSRATAFRGVPRRAAEALRAHLRAHARPRVRALARPSTSRRPPRARTLLTGSTAETGERWVTIGWLLVARPRPAGHVLEFGPGWGHPRSRSRRSASTSPPSTPTPTSSKLISRCAGAAGTTTLVPGDMLDLRAEASSRRGALLRVVSPLLRPAAAARAPRSSSRRAAASSSPPSRSTTSSCRGACASTGGRCGRCAAMLARAGLRDRFFLETLRGLRVERGCGRDRSRRARWLTSSCTRG